MIYLKYVVISNTKLKVRIINLGYQFYGFIEEKKSYSWS